MGYEKYSIYNVVAKKKIGVVMITLKKIIKAGYNWSTIIAGSSITANESSTAYTTNLRANGNIQCNGNILANQSATFSDERIKTNIIDIDDTSALAIIRQIQPKIYNYKDVRTRGDTPVWGC